MSPAYQFFAGIFFTAVALLFLYAAFRRTNFQRLHYDIVHYVCALCAGAAGAFFTGTALISFNGKLGSGSTLAFQGTAGVALFALVFLIFRFRFSYKVLDHEVSGAKEAGAWISLSGENPFSQVAEIIAGAVGATVDLSSLTPEEKLQRPSSDQQIDCSTVALATVALQDLREKVRSGSIRRYSVIYDMPTKRFKLIT